MNRVKTGFCLFLFILSCFYFKDIFKDLDLVDLILNKSKNLSISKIISNKDIEEPVSLLDLNDKTVPLNIEKDVSITKKTDNSPKVYIFNTHQKEEYASNAYNITPTVVTVSNILKDELSELGINSIVETKDIIKETNRRGYDYTGTYTVSFEYLKQQKKENESLEYFFDIHRDSIKKSVAKVKVNNKNYASVMFLVGANYKGYEEHVNNSNIMKKYLDKHYPGLVRNTYIQKNSSFYQYYSPNMFLIEVGGPSNTLEEIYNSTKALAEAINYYMEEKE